VTTEKTTATKPKHVSKTKQELRRLREFAEFFSNHDEISVNGVTIDEKSLASLKRIANYALTGKAKENR